MNFSTVGLTAFQGRIDSFLLGETKALSKRNIPMALGAIAATFYAASIVKGFRAEVVEPLLKKCVSSYPDAKKIFDEYIKEPQSILYQKENYDRHKGAASFLIGLQVVAILVTLSTSGTTKKIAFYTNIFFGMASYAISPNEDNRKSYITMGRIGAIGLFASEKWMKTHA